MKESRICIIEGCSNICKGKSRICDQIHLLPCPRCNKIIEVSNIYEYRRNNIICNECKALSEKTKQKNLNRKGSKERENRVSQYLEPQVLDKTGYNYTEKLKGVHPEANLISKYTKLADKHEFLCSSCGNNYIRTARVTIEI